MKKAWLVFLFSLVLCINWVGCAFSASCDYIYEANHYLYAVDPCDGQTRRIEWKGNDYKWCSNGVVITSKIVNYPYTDANAWAYTYDPIRHSWSEIQLSTEGFDELKQVGTTILVGYWNWNTAFSIFKYDPFTGTWDRKDITSSHEIKYDYYGEMFLFRYSGGAELWTYDYEDHQWHGGQIVSGESVNDGRFWWGDGFLVVEQTNKVVRAWAYDPFKHAFVAVSPYVTTNGVYNIACCDGGFIMSYKLSGSNYEYIYRHTYNALPGGNGYWSGGYWKTADQYSWVDCQFALKASPGTNFTWFRKDDGTVPHCVRFLSKVYGCSYCVEWNFGDGGYSYEEHPLHTYQAPGDYTVTLTAINSDGRSYTHTKTIHIGARPDARFTASPTSGVKPLTVNFIDQSTGDVTSWSWTFGDGYTSTSRNPSHTYNSAGDYTVSLTAKGPYGQDTETKTAYISVKEPAPVANFSASPTSGNAPLTVQFTDKSTGSITSWSWNFGDGGTSAQRNPSHNYDSAGDYTVKLTVTGPGGSGTKTAQSYIHVTTAPPPPSNAIAVIRQKLDGKQRLQLFSPPTTPGMEVESPFASDVTFGNANDNSRRIAVAGVDINGDGVDEIAVIQQKQGGGQQLKIFNAPSEPADNIEPAIASDLTFGNANTDKNRVLLAGVDIDGDGIDEIAVIEQNLAGKHLLKIFRAPTGPEMETEPAIGSDLTFGNVYQDSRKTALAGVDIDGDGIDEIAVIQQKLNGKQQLKIFRAPTEPKQGITVIASDLTFGNADTDKNRILLAGVDIDGDGIDEIAVIEQNLAGKHLLKILRAPTGPEIETEPAIASDLTFGSIDNDNCNVAIAGLKI